MKDSQIKLVFFTMIVIKLLKSRTALLWVFLEFKSDFVRQHTRLCRSSFHRALDFVETIEKLPREGRGLPAPQKLSINYSRSVVLKKYRTFLVSGSSRVVGVNDFPEHQYFAKAFGLVQGDPQT